MAADAGNEHTRVRMRLALSANERSEWNERREWIRAEDAERRQARGGRSLKPSSRPRTNEVSERVVLASGCVPTSRER